MMYVLSVIIVVLISVLVNWLWDRRNLYWLSSKIPGPIGWPIIGSGINYLLESQGNLIFLAKLTKRYGSPFRVWLGPKLYIIVSKKEDIETVLTSPNCVNRSHLTNKYIKDGIGGDGLFTLDDEKWKKSRRIIAPSFNYNVIVNYIPLFDKNSQECVRQLEKYVGNDPFDIRPVIELSTVVSFFESSMNREVSPEIMQKCGEILSEGLKMIGIRMFCPWYESDFIWNLSKYGRKMKKLKKAINEIKDVVFHNVAISNSINATLLQRLLRTSKENEDFTFDDIKSEITTTLTAATDTSTWSIAITLLLLAMHPDIQDKVVDELRQIFPNKNSAIRKEDLQKLNYLHMCIQEELRLFPSLPLMARRVDRLWKLRNYDIPAGTPIILNFHQLHRNPEYWGSNADKFDPNNFSPENIDKIKPFTFLPFSGGPRNCIGTHYAMIVMKTTLANILRNYKVTTSLKFNEISIESNINIVVRNSCMVQLELRNF